MSCLLALKKWVGLDDLMTNGFDESVEVTDEEMGCDMAAAEVVTVVAEVTAVDAVVVVVVAAAVAAVKAEVWLLF